MTGVPPAPLPDLISWTPDPPVRGQPLKICYAFREGDPSPVSLEIRWTTPNGMTTEVVQVSRANPCATVQVPGDATAILITDLSGTSADAGGII